VSGTESVVDVQIGRRGKLLGEVLVVLGLLLVEPYVLKEHDATLGEVICHLVHLVTNAVRSHHAFSSQKLSKSGRHWGQRELVLGPVLRAAQVRREKHLGTLLHQVLHCGDGSSDAGIISNGLAIKRDVQVATHEDLLALELSLTEVTHRLLGHLKHIGTGVHSAGNAIEGLLESGSSCEEQSQHEELHVVNHFE